MLHTWCRSKKKEQIQFLDKIKRKINKYFLTNKHQRLQLCSVIFYFV